ncbi:MAG: DbpA RNA binding domain-containing protein [Treponema sp.]|jgi:hypothetical protein|nr:DbpA RNA binding domain-containing protein [Treponema sp.]
MNEEGLKKRIRVLLEELHTKADPVLLNRCRSIFRREVSFFRRSYIAAYLLLLAEGETGGGSSSIKAGGKPSRKRPSSPETRQEGGGADGKGRRERKRGEGDKNQGLEPNRSLSDEESARLFISIGRNRKVFPREILALINAEAQVAREDIGAIRILDNFSFIQVRTGAAETVIQALNGHSFRGRTLTVSYARGRREGEEESAPAAPPGQAVSGQSIQDDGAFSASLTEAETEKEVHDDIGSDD